MQSTHTFPSMPCFQTHHCSCPSSHVPLAPNLFSGKVMLKQELTSDTLSLFKMQDSSLWNPLLVKSTTAAGGWIHCVAAVSPARVQPVRGVLQRAAVQHALIAGGHVCTLGCLTSSGPHTQALSPDPDFGVCLGSCWNRMRISSQSPPMCWCCYMQTQNAI